MLRTIFSKRAFIAPVSLLLAGVSCEAFSQAEAPLAPVRQVLDENGVDLLTGRFNVSQQDIDIGPPEARLAFVRSAKTEEWGDPFSFYNNVEVALLFVPAEQTPDGVPYVAVGSATSSERFTQSGSTFTSQAGTGATLVWDVPTQRYIYTGRDGTVYRFPAPTNNETRALVLSIEAPDGTRTEYSSKEWPNPPYTYRTNRVQSVVNNAGYQLKVEYDGAQSTRITKVAVLNRGNPRPLLQTIRS